ncbi:MAG: gliding-motility protein MglA [Lentisphaerae bacterium]|jgi:mutual gliding-motility protein MglA|nr:gliding-motility protein MglA [Lentisphaerota bacterium]MBT4821243.1 gliding-motility protein MglA [Lentisphaerota bacterium]MBT5611069.1 gliding-motility protein MglA [Lentisphaerota bacterium]MBT7055324.1 gliding-motility protein MglA [Lentisphaerota bacterium]MBT7840525.1 gliding-motility protein MglA [Lentisphaerota bacterium]
MAFVNQASREVQLKIVYYGPALSGKTTNLETIHERIRPDHKGDLTSLDTAQDRTLFFDFMPLEADAIKGFKTRFLMYTVPGQVMYNTTRRIVLRGVDGVVFVADSQWGEMEANVESLSNLEENLRAQGSSLEHVPHVIQFNKRDLDNIAPEHYMEFVLNNGETRRPSFSSVATDGTGVFEALNMIARLVLHRFVSGPTGKDAEGQQLRLVD